jgi:hypothetical protein
MIARFNKPIPHTHDMSPQGIHGFRPGFGGVNVCAVAEDHGRKFKF